MRPSARLGARPSHPIYSRLHASATSATSPGLNDDDNARFRFRLEHPGTERMEEEEPNLVSRRRGPTAQQGLSLDARLARRVPSEERPDRLTPRRALGHCQTMRLDGKTGLVLTSLLIAAACRTGQVARVNAPTETRLSAAKTRVDIQRYDVQVDVDIPARSISGATAVTFRCPGPPPRALRFPLNELDVEGVRYEDEQTAFYVDKQARALVIPLPATPPSSTQEHVTVTYHTTPKHGLTFGERFVYGDFFTCHWMVCSEEPGDKAAFGLEVVVPSSYEVIASGTPVYHHVDAAGRLHSRWTEERPYSPYLYSFAAGELIETRIQEGDAELRLFGVRGIESEESLHRKLEDTSRRALRFLEDRAGVPLPGGVYSQVLLPGHAAQEKSSFSLIGSGYVDPILEDPTEDWVIVHEMAHQWWGNLVTCRDWSHFWLNESLATFMVAAYKEERWGRSAYDRELALWNERWDVARQAGYNVPLAYAGTYPSLRVRRAIQYSKGAVFLDRLRERMGDAAFWNGIKAFTVQHAGGTVTSNDFQSEMQAASTIDLGPMFREWVGNDGGRLR
jgi:aminopeptidase N